MFVFAVILSYMNQSEAYGSVSSVRSAGSSEARRVSFNSTGSTGVRVGSGAGAGAGAGDEAPLPPGKMSWNE